jgi:3-deoxy-D-manno-octulosonic-acid transferase
LKWAVYNLLFAAAFPLMLPGFLLRMLRRGGYRARMLDRFALYPADLLPGSAEASRDAGFVWLHAVSVGEVQVAAQLMEEWRKAEPGVRFCFSTTSSTGWRVAEKAVRERDILIYNPLDFPNFAKSAIFRIRPRAVILTESEIWPNFVRTAAKAGVPVFLINARVSDRSAPRYRFARFFFGDVLRRFSRIFAQSALDRDRLVAAGADPRSVETTGSFKFDAARRNPAKEAEMRAWIGAPGRILLGGSTWPGEDTVLLDIAKTLDGVTLVIAPRHFEKADAVEANILAAGFACVRRSRGDKPPADGRRAVYLADTTGELMGLYGIADAVFVGKTLFEKGGQNMIEPCLCGKPVAVGPHTENFRPVMSDLLDAKAIVQVKDAAALGDTQRRFFKDGDGGLGARALKAVRSRCGVVPKCVAAIRAKLPAKAPFPEEPPFHAGSAFARAALAVAFFALVLSALWLVRDRLPHWKAPAPAQAERTLPKLKAMRTAGAFIALAEMPGAVSAFAAGDDAKEYAEAIAATGVPCLTAETEKDAAAKYDIVFASGVPPSDLGAAFAKTAEGGALVWSFEAHKMTAGEFKKALESFPCKEAHLWMPGERDWIIAGRTGGETVKMGDLMDIFSRPEAISPEAEEAGCGSMQELFASYAGSREDVMPAFESGDMSAPARPEFFVSKETPDLDWIVPDDMYADIVEMLAERIRALQEVRRSIVRACARSTEPGGMDEAVSLWAEAMKKNPHDTMLLDRLYLMAVNARAFHDVGNVAGAAQCYEAMVAIRPNDRRVVAEYAKCLRNLGKKEMAAAIERRMREEKDAR